MMRVVILQDIILIQGNIGDHILVLQDQNAEIPVPQETDILILRDTGIPIPVLRDPEIPIPIPRNTEIPILILRDTEIPDLQDTEARNSTHQVMIEREREGSVFCEKNLVFYLLIFY